MKSSLSIPLRIVSMTKMSSSKTIQLLRKKKTALIPRLLLMIRLQGPKHHHTLSFHKTTHPLSLESDPLLVLPFHIIIIISSSKPKFVFLFFFIIHPGAALFLPWRSGREADLSWEAGGAARRRALSVFVCLFV